MSPLPLLGMPLRLLFFVASFALATHAQAQLFIQLHYTDETGGHTETAPFNAFDYFKTWNSPSGESNFISASLATNYTSHSSNSWSFTLTNKVEFFATSRPTNSFSLRGGSTLFREFRANGLQVAAIRGKTRQSQQLGQIDLSARVGFLDSEDDLRYLAGIGHDDTGARSSSTNILLRPGTDYALELDIVIDTRASGDQEERISIDMDFQVDVRPASLSVDVSPPNAYRLTFPLGAGIQFSDDLTTWSGHHVPSSPFQVNNHGIITTQWFSSTNRARFFRLY